MRIPKKVRIVNAAKLTPAKYFFGLINNRFYCRICEDKIIGERGWSYACALTTCLQCCPDKDSYLKSLKDKEYLD